MKMLGIATIPRQSYLKSHLVMIENVEPKI